MDHALRKFGVGMCLTLVAACGDNQDPRGAEELWMRLETFGYRSFRRAPGYEARRKSNAPHGNDVEIFVNEPIAKILDGPKGATTYPDGSLIVKEGYAGDTLELVAVMEKRNGEWYWAEYDAIGNAMYSGKPALCINCHASGTDFVRAFSWP